MGAVEDPTRVRSTIEEVVATEVVRSETLETPEKKDADVIKPEPLDWETKNTETTTGILDQAFRDLESLVAFKHNLLHLRYCEKQDEYDASLRAWCEKSLDSPKLVILYSPEKQQWVAHLFVKKVEGQNGFEVEPVSIDPESELGKALAELEEERKAEAGQEQEEEKPRKDQCFDHEFFFNLIMSSDSQVYFFRMRRILFESLAKSNDTFRRLVGDFGPDIRSIEDAVDFIFDGDQEGLYGSALADSTKFNDLLEELENAVDEYVAEHQERRAKRRSSGGVYSNASSDAELSQPLKLSLLNGSVKFSSGSENSSAYYLARHLADDPTKGPSANYPDRKPSFIAKFATSVFKKHYHYTDEQLARTAQLYPFRAQQFVNQQRSVKLSFVRLVQSLLGKSFCYVLGLPIIASKRTLDKLDVAIRKSEDNGKSVFYNFQNDLRCKDWAVESSLYAQEHLKPDQDSGSENNDRLDQLHRELDEACKERFLDEGVGSAVCSLGIFASVDKGELSSSEPSFTKKEGHVKDQHTSKMIDGRIK